MKINKKWFQYVASGRYAYLASQLPTSSVRLLDVGNVGGGYSSHRRIQELIQARGGIVVGCDLNFASALQERHANQVIGNIFSLPFDAGSFDVVYMGEIVEHLWNPITALGEIYRVLDNGGYLILDTPNVFSVGRIANWWVRHLDDIGDLDHKFLFTPASLGNLLTNAGFEVNEMVTDAKLHIGRVRFAWLPGGKRLGSHLCVTAIKV